MKIQQLHSWQVSIAQAQEIQRCLAAQVLKVSEVTLPRFVAGIDTSPPNVYGVATGAVVVLRLPELTIAEIEVAAQEVNFPYIPGFLSFREAPLILAACQKLSIDPDLLVVDGQGIAHPRRLGLASHVGLLLDMPTIGCAKSLLWGRHQLVEAQAGSFALLRDGEEVIGAALRTKATAKAVYVSIGHKVSLEAAIYWIMQCCRGYRLPEPTRLAHLAAAGQLKLPRENQAEQGYQQQLFN
jgi:deoxyribonuclease V